MIAYRAAEPEDLYPGSFWRRKHQAVDDDVRTKRNDEQRLGRIPDAKDPCGRKAERGNLSSHTCRNE